MVGEETVDEAHLVDDEEPEGEAEQAGRRSEIAVEPRGFCARVLQGRGEGDGDHHHASDSADPEHQEVGDGPVGIVQRGEHEEGDGRGSGEAVNQTDNQRAAPLVEAPPAQVRSM